MTHGEREMILLGLVRRLAGELTSRRNVSGAHRGREAEAVRVRMEIRALLSLRRIWRTSEPWAGKRCETVPTVEEAETIVREL